MRTFRRFNRVVTLSLFITAISATVTHFTNIGPRDFIAETTAQWKEDLPTFKSIKNKTGQSDTAKPKATNNSISLEFLMPNLDGTTAPNILASNQNSSSSPNSFTIPKKVEDMINFNKYQKVEVLATAYTAGYESTRKKPTDRGFGITSSGVRVKRDLFSTIAADTKIFPFGTILFIPEYGFGVVADRGAAIKGKHIDLYFQTVAETHHLWGKKTLNVYVVRKGNGKVDEGTLNALNENEAIQAFRKQFTGKK